MVSAASSGHRNLLWEKLTFLPLHERPKRLGLVAKEGVCKVSAASSWICLREKLTVLPATKHEHHKRLRLDLSEWSSVSVRQLPLMPSHIWIVMPANDFHSDSV